MDVGRASRGPYSRRGRVSRRRDRKVFSRTARRSRSENMLFAPMRGGTRL